MIYGQLRVWHEAVLISPLPQEGLNYSKIDYKPLTSEAMTEDSLNKQDIF